MEFSAPIVKSVDTRDGKLSVRFEDGHTAEFWGFRKDPSSPINGLRRFCLFNGEQKKVVHYDGRLTMSKRARLDQHCFVLVVDGYTNQIIADYWEAAWTYIDKRHTREGRRVSSGYAGPWKILNEGSADLKKIRSLNALLPIPKKA